MAFESSDGTVQGEKINILSGREYEVLSLIAEGRSSKEAADHLFVSKRTVDFHLANVYSKLGVANRVHAIRVAVRLGLLYGGTAFRRDHDVEVELERELMAVSPEPYEPSGYRSRIATRPRNS